MTVNDMLNDHLWDSLEQADSFVQSIEVFWNADSHPKSCNSEYFKVNSLEKASSFANSFTECWVVLVLTSYSRCDHSYWNRTLKKALGFAKSFAECFSLKRFIGGDKTLEDAVLTKALEFADTIIECNEIYFYAPKEKFNETFAGYAYASECYTCETREGPIQIMAINKAMEIAELLPPEERFEGYISIAERISFDSGFAKKVIGRLRELADSPGQESQIGKCVKSKRFTDI